MTDNDDPRGRLLTVCALIEKYPHDDEVAALLPSDLASATALLGAAISVLDVIVTDVAAGSGEPRDEILAGLRHRVQQIAFGEGEAA